MKNVLLFLVFIPFFLSAQNPSWLKRPMAPAQGLKSVQTTTIFTGEKKGKTFTDTAFKEMSIYNTNGTLASKSYASILDKAAYTSVTTYNYAPECSWGRLIYEDNRLVDSAEYSDCGLSVGIRYIYGANGLHEIYKYKGDSVSNIIVDRPDTLRRNWSRVSELARDPEWDYVYAEEFDRKETVRSGNVDSVRYFNKKSKCIFMIVHRYDNADRAVRAEYFNYGVKKFAVLSMRYNDRLSVTEWVVKSRGGKPSYTIDRAYNDKGLLMKETFQWQRKGRYPIVKNYDYEFYD
jgi:hypothetical protein